MLKLARNLLDRALKAIVHHGYGTFFPVPPELEIVRKNWAGIAPELASVDLDTYQGYDLILSFAPKSRLNVRRVALLHPCDMIFYTALLLVLKGLIAKSRLPADKVFSYRTEGTTAAQLYTDVSAWKDFRAMIQARAVDDPDCIVGVTDIADFFPRIYHHRLINALDVAAGRSMKDYVRVLEKMLTRFSGGTSYGIPVGPPASRLLGEAVLADVDSTLVSFGIEFVRFVDDYVIFAKRVQDAEYGIRVLGEILFKNHGLTLQTAKTQVLSAGTYVERKLVVHSEKEKERVRLLQIFGDAEYEVSSYDELDAAQQAEIDAFNLSQMLEEALVANENVDYREVQFILGRLSALRKTELIPIAIGNLERLYPVAESIAAFFKAFKKLSKEEVAEIGSALLAPILNSTNARPSDYYAMWILSIFQEQENWDHADNLLRIFRETSSDAVRRFAALALATCGSRSQILAVKEYLASGSPLTRTAMLLATQQLGKDERRHFGKSLQLNDSLEKLCITAKA